MEVAEYQNVAANETDHFYYVAVHDLILRLVDAQPKPDSAQILDAGCGTGWLAKQLEQYGSVRAIDMHDEAIRFARARGVDVTQTSIEDLPFAEDTFDLATSVDVIYHRAVKDDLNALRQINRVLKPGGRLVLRVPAEPSLHSSHDEFVHTARRYRGTELKKKLMESNFKVERLSYCQSPLFFPAWVKARIDGRKAGDHNSVIEPPAPWVNQLISKILQAENDFIIAEGYVPKGIGLVAVCRKLK